MCGYRGHRSLPASVGADLSRRRLLKRAADGAVVVGLGGPLIGHGGAAFAQSSVKATHGTGFCNLALFLTHARQLAEEDGVRLEFVNSPTFADQVTFFGAGRVDMSVLPYTSFVALYDAGAPVRIVAGGGVEGCVLVSQPGLDTAEKLKGTTLGTFQLDTLEVLPYDWLKANGVGFDEINVRYMGSTPEAAEAFKAGALDWTCSIEPYATSLVEDVEGAHLLSDGTDLYGAGYTDCVLAARTELIEEAPEVVKAIIKGMMQAQHAFESERDAVLEEVVGRYYKTSMENAVIGATKQPPVVDMRDKTDFILGRVESLVEMGYIKNKPGREAIDWSLLETVIAENPELYAQLEMKA